MKYPNLCCRCGFCCLHELCPVAKALYGDLVFCPALSFDGVVAICSLAGKVVPVGDGCCIKARAYKDGVEYDFASLDPSLKVRAAQDLLKRKEKNYALLGNKYSVS